MLPGQWKDGLIDIDVDANLTAEIDLGRQYETALIVVPTRTVSSQVSLEVAEKTGGTFQDLHDCDRADGSSHQIISAAGTAAFTWIAPLGGFQYVKIKLSADQTGSDQTFRICGVRS